MTDIFQSLGIIALAVTALLQQRTINQLMKHTYGLPEDEGRPVFFRFPWERP